MRARYQLRRSNRDLARRIAAARRPQQPGHGEIAEAVHQPWLMPVRPSRRSGQERINAKRSERAVLWAALTRPDLVRDHFVDAMAYLGSAYDLRFGSALCGEIAQRMPLPLPKSIATLLGGPDDR